MLVTRSEMVLKVIAMSFERVVIFSFDLPMTPTRFDGNHHIIIIKFMRAYESIVVKDFAVITVGGEFTPINH